MNIIARYDTRYHIVVICRCVAVISYGSLEPVYVVGAFQTYITAVEAHEKARRIPQLLVVSRVRSGMSTVSIHGRGNFPGHRKIPPVSGLDVGRTVFIMCNLLNPVLVDFHRS